VRPGFRVGDQQCRGEGAVARVDGDLRVLEAEPAAGQREPGLVDRLLRAEQQPVPADAPHRGEPGQHDSFPRAGDQAEHAIGQHVIGLGVDTDGEDLVRVRDRGRAVAGTVRDAAHDAGWPLGRAAFPPRDRGWRHSQPGQGAVGAVPGRAELTAPFTARLGDGQDLFWKQRRLRRIAERLRGRYGGRQDLFDHAGVRSRLLACCRGAANGRAAVVPAARGTARRAAGAAGWRCSRPPPGPAR